MKRNIHRRTDEMIQTALVDGLLMVAGFATVAAIPISALALTRLVRSGSDSQEDNTE